jgi:hypothetical protein
MIIGKFNCNKSYGDYTILKIKKGDWLFNKAEK